MSDKFQVCMVINDTLVMGGIIATTADKARADNIAQLLNACIAEAPSARMTINYVVLRLRAGGGPEGSVKP